MVSTVQIPVPDLGTGFTSEVQFWSTEFDDVLVLTRESSGVQQEYVCIERVDAVPDADTLSAVLAVGGVTIMDFLDVEVQKGFEPPGDRKISRWYMLATLGGVQYYVTPRAYLYRVVEAVV